MDHFKNMFIEEATDLIAGLERCLLLVRNDLKNAELIGEIFRNMHSLKGGSAMVGFKHIAAFTHIFETLFVEIKSEKIEFTIEILDLTLLATDHIKLLLNKEDEIEGQELQDHQALIEKIRSNLFSLGINQGNAVANQKNESEETKGNSFFIIFKPHKDILRKGSNPLGAVLELTTTFENIVISHTNDIKDLNTIDAYECYTYWFFIIHTDQQVDAIKDVFMFFEDECDLEIHHIAENNVLKDVEFVKEIKDLIKLQSTVSLIDIQELLNKKKLNSDKNKLENKIKNNLPQEEQQKNEKKKNSNGISSIRVPSEKLDKLINLVSELVTTQASLSLIAEKSGLKDMLAIAEDIEKISRNLRDNTFSIRLIPLDSMMSRFRRMIIDLSKELNKEIDFETEGTDTELDKTIIENLFDPIMHIIRNSIDHGIENSELRLKNGKNVKGKIKLKAFYSGSNVHIQISDDGCGLNENLIRHKAISKGIISSDTQLTRQDILDLIFLPGFSTSESVTQISGRGVGMDVVKRKISDIRGEVSIDSRLNEGTTITIKLPLTLSIIDGLLVLIDNTHYVIPLASVDKCFEFKHNYLMNAVNNMIYVNDGHIPLVYLRKVFEVKSEPKEIEQVIVIQYNDMRIGLAVDYVIGEYQAVLKSLGKMYKKQEIISGATILGDGTVALVVDPNKVIFHATQYAYEMI